MDSAPPTINDGVVAVDPFLVEALQNPCHRLTSRYGLGLGFWRAMKLGLTFSEQKFLKNSDQQQFEFQHFPTSYLRLAAHRVAQHYGLQTMVQDNVLDGLGTRIVVKKLADSRYPATCLSEIPGKQLENDKHEPIKIVMRPRPSKILSEQISGEGIKGNSARTVEERKEEYDKARARIFSGSSLPMSEGFMLQVPLGTKNTCLSGDENGGCKNSMIDTEKTPSFRDSGTFSQVAVFRDKEKDRTDPDYDRSYTRYAKTMNYESFKLVPFNMQNFQAPVQYCHGFPQLGQMQRKQASISYRTPVMRPFSVAGLNQTSGDAVYMQWPTSAMMYAQSDDQFMHDVFQRADIWSNHVGQAYKEVIWACLMAVCTVARALVTFPSLYL
ncbi:hypothetical protein RHSIM_RhsimUnG0209500 [Rhododendron simsii]|uniref:SUZ domain-containing protein n=1 Tax=Rhododendron simsii TaxID=118357 RepID=A0A834L3J3_RHOSS|nr:hypothetical protein RHSIM_RhsimUnG0209500 [Rhododendron simsii]